MAVKTVTGIDPTLLLQGAGVGAPAPVRLAPARRSSDASRRLGWVKVCMALTDALALLLSIVVSHRLVFGLSPLPIANVWAALSAPLIWIATFKAWRLYETEHLSSWEELRRTVNATTLGGFGVLMVSFWSTSTFSRTWLGISWVLSTVLVLLIRRVWRHYMTKLKVDGKLSLRTLIVGANSEAYEISKQIKPAHLGFQPLGYVSVTTTAATANGIPVLDDLDNIERAIVEHNADCLFVASTAVSSEEMLRVAQAARKQGVQVKVSANVPEMLTSRLTVQPIGSMMGLSLRPVTLTRAQMAVKRTFDLTLASIALLISFPLWVATAVAIKLTSRGPILFTQERATQGGRFFSIYKFRTMVTDGDRLLEEHGLDPSSPFFKVKGDPRVTKIGRFIRRLSIDEIPQLINVIRGDMSLVGPRPLPSDQVLANVELLGPRLEVPAGVTGWWQIQGRSDVGAHEALRMDLFYIENWSLALDLYIVLKTAGALLARRGAI